jgi:hypothetical protein
VGEPIDQFVKCPLTQSDVIIMKSGPAGATVEIRKTVRSTEVSL